MSSSMKHSLIHSVLWLIVAVLFVTIFFSASTITNWGDNPIKTVLLASLFFVGLGGDTILRVVFRKSKIVKDERDDYIQQKAMATSFTVAMVYIFVVAIALYTYYDAQGVVPMAWVWFIAYSLIIVANLCGSIFSLYYYWKSDR